MKILILYTDAGGGHKSVAKASKEILEKNSRCKVTTINFYKSIINSNAEDSYNLLLRLNLGKYYWKIVIFFRLYLYCFKRHFLNKIKKNLIPILVDYDIVVSVIPFFNNIIKIGLNNASYKGKFLIFPTDLSNPYLNYWFNECDGFILASEKLVKQHLASKYAAIKTYSLGGLPLRSDFYNNKIEDSRLNLDVSARLPKKVLLIFGKSPSTRFVYSLVNSIYNYISDVQLMIVCGENKMLFQKLNKKYNNDPRIITYKFVNNICELIDLSDIVVTKPGPTSIIESAIRGKYLLVQNDSNVLEHERYNLDYIIENSIGERFSSSDDLCNKILDFQRTVKKNESFISELKNTPIQLLKAFGLANL